MIFALPIPRFLLIHTVTYERHNADDSFSNAYFPPVTLQNVRIDPTTRLVRNSNGDSINAKATLFYDCSNSTPLNQVFEEKARVTWNGQQYYVLEVSQLFTDRLHHIEVTLI